MQNRWLLVGILVFASTASWADILHSPKFTSPSGKYEVIFVSTASAAVPFSHTANHVPPGQKPQYILLFYVAGDSDSISADWYTDINPPPTEAQVAQSLLWSPKEDFVVVTHGQTAKAAGVTHWIIAMKNPSAYGVEGTELQWIDETRLVANLKTKKVPGGVELVDAKKQHAELIVSPHAGLGYELASVKDHRITVQQYLNHWGEEREKTSWEFFDPACFELDLDTLKKRSVACSK